MPIVKMTMMIMMMTTITLATAASNPSHQFQSPNLRPIIGIVSVDTAGRQHGTTYIPVSYVSYLQQAGARVVPIRGGRDEQYYNMMVNVTNGVLFPGGSVRLDTSSMYGRSVRHVVRRAMQINQAGDVYPVWGTCLGFQALCYQVAGSNLLQPTDSANMSLPLNLTAEASSSRLLGDAPPDILGFLQQEHVTQNQHSYSILTQTFKSSKKLSSFFKLLSTNDDRKGVGFVSTVEGRTFPFYGSQWHPEKNAFNWNPHYVINHSNHAVRVGQFTANFFVDQARKSRHRFPDAKTEAASMIQNYKRVYFNDGSYFDNYYFHDL